MANHHLQGRTTAFVADPVVDWFATFETWITAVVGWTMALRVSDTEFFLSSIGEAGAYTKLFVHIWRVGVSDQVRMEVCDDAVPTHQTGELGYVDGAGQTDILYFMSANLECIVIAWTIEGHVRFVYAGALMPYGIAPVDETYYMVATSDHGSCSILRNSAGVWDQDKFNYWNAQSDNVTGDINCDNFHLFPLYADQQNNIAGQYWFLSGEIGGNTNVSAGDRLTSAISGATSTWIVLVDQSVNKFALWTGGTLPAGIPSGHFNAASGVANSGPNLAISVAGAAAAHGWTGHGDPGFPRADPGDQNVRMTSNGETIGPLNMTISWDNSANQLQFWVQDDAIYTHVTWSYLTLDNIWPKPYYECGDRDCIVVSAHENTFNTRPVLWGGLLAMGAPDLPDPVNMRLAAATLEQTANVAGRLRYRDGTWSPASLFDYQDNNTRLNTNANAFDPTTYYVHPNFVRTGLYEFVGITKYFAYTNGGGIAWNDTITIGAEVYRVHEYKNTPLFCAIRSV